MSAVSPACCPGAKRVGPRAAAPDLWPDSERHYPPRPASPPPSLTRPLPRPAPPPPCHREPRAAAKPAASYLPWAGGSPKPASTQGPLTTVRRPLPVPHTLWAPHGSPRASRPLTYRGSSPQPSTRGISSSPIVDDPLFCAPPLAPPPGTSPPFPARAGTPGTRGPSPHFLRARGQPFPPRELDLSYAHGASLLFLCALGPPAFAAQALTSCAFRGPCDPRLEPPSWMRGRSRPFLRAWGPPARAARALPPAHAARREPPLRGGAARAPTSCVGGASWDGCPSLHTKSSLAEGRVPSTPKKQVATRGPRALNWAWRGSHPRAVYPQPRKERSPLAGRGAQLGIQGSRPVLRTPRKTHRRIPARGPVILTGTYRGPHPRVVCP